jgi:hypothetical protein
MLGNLAVSAQQARGQYVWVIGDDDLIVPGALDRILAAIAIHPDVDLVYTNYAFTSSQAPTARMNPREIIYGAALVSTQVRDEYSREIRSICSKSENCFTAIYCLVFRAEHALRAYCQDTRGPPFSSLPTCVPSTHYVLDHMLDLPGYWVGDPCVVVNMNVSWSRYAALYVLERFPEIFDRMEANGVDPGEVDCLRFRHLPSVVAQLSEVYFGTQREHVESVSIERLVRRFARLPEFPSYWPALRALHVRAVARGRLGALVPSPERLDNLIRETRASPSSEG